MDFIPLQDRFENATSLQYLSDLVYAYPIKSSLWWSIPPNFGGVKVLYNEESKSVTLVLQRTKLFFGLLQTLSSFNPCGRILQIKIPQSVCFSLVQDVRKHILLLSALGMAILMILLYDPNATFPNVLGLIVDAGMLSAEGYKWPTPIPVQFPALTIREHRNTQGLVPLCSTWCKRIAFANSEAPSALVGITNAELEVRWNVTW